MPFTALLYWTKARNQLRVLSTCEREAAVSLCSCRREQVSRHQLLVIETERSASLAINTRHPRVSPSTSSSHRMSQSSQRSSRREDATCIGVEREACRSRFATGSRKLLQSRILQRRSPSDRACVLLSASAAPSERVKRTVLTAAK